MTVTYLKSAYLFQGLSESELEAVAGSASEQIVEADQYVYRKGDEGICFYVIAEGKVQLIAEQQGGSSSVVEQISSGGHFGEVSLLTGKTRSLSVKAQKKTRLLVFDAAAFKTVLLANSRIHELIDIALAERLSLASLDREVSGALPKGKVQREEPDEPQEREQGKGETGSGEEVIADRSGDELELARRIRKKIEFFAGLDSPVLICGESGTGRRLAAKQIHLNSERRAAPYIELDMRQFKSWIWEGKLFGYKRDSFPFSSGRQLGILEQVHNGTLVLYHAEKVSWELQQMLFHAYQTRKFTSVDSQVEQDLDTRFIFIADDTVCEETGEPLFVPGLKKLFSDHQFQLPPLREHKEDILPLVNYYLKRYNAELGKEVKGISSGALGKLMKYDWPGNLTELSNVVQRAVMVSAGPEIYSEHIFLGLIRSKERLSFNLLQLPKVRQAFKGKLAKVVSTFVFTFFCIIVLTLFFGPQDPQKNLGIVLCWYIGWPLLIISFFFLPRYWCSICALSAPGKKLQTILKPTRRVPYIITKYSGWIMALLCLLVFWAEIVFNAYDSPMLTGGILLSIASGALIFSMLFERYSWCRYVCPLGALNAIFSMPSILELRANREMCINQCRDYVCYRDTDSTSGCPMYRHPFLVDNNKDCILCGRCIQNCNLRSIELNLRLAPRELWSLQNVKVSDSFLIVSLGVVFFFLVFHDELLPLAEKAGQLFSVSSHVGAVFAETVIFWVSIILGWLAYLIFSKVQAVVLKKRTSYTASVFGYGLLPLVLGGFLAYYANMFIRKSWQIVPNILTLFGIEMNIHEFPLLAPAAISTFLHIIILGGMIAAGYATYKICRRLVGENLKLKHLASPLMVVLVFGIAYLLSI